MKRLYKRVLSFVMSCAILLMAVPFVALPVFAADSTISITGYDTTDQIETLINNASGVASVSGGTVTVTGEFNYDQDTFDAPTIRLYPGVTIKWQAELNGTYVRIDSRSTGGTFELADGGGIYNNSFGIYNVSKAVNIKVSGGTIYCENDNLSTEPAIETNGNIEITGGEIIVNNFYAIRMETAGNDGTRARETLTVSGDAQIKANGTYDAIYVSEYKTVNINGGTITGDADIDGVAVYRDAINSSQNNIININGGTINGQIYLNKDNVLNINGGTISNHGVTVFLFDAGNEINITGGTVTSSNSGTLFTNSYGTGNTNVVNISGGTVTNTDSGAFAIDGDFKEINISGGDVFAPWGAIYTEGDVTVSGGTVKASTNSRPAIWGAAGKNVSVTGGLVYASRSNNIVSYATLTVTEEGMVVGFNPSTGRGQYANGFSTDIHYLPNTASAVWATVGATNGISYTNGLNTGFIPITGPDVISSSDTVIIDGKTSAEIAAAVATAFNTFDLVMVTGTNTALTSGISLTIPNEKTLNWSASTEAASGIGAAILTLSGPGTFNMNGGYIKNAYGDGISASGTVKINIKGGEISVADDIGINSTGTGLIEVTNAAIEATVEGGKAIYSAGQINIKSGSTIEVPYGTALESTSNIYIYNIDVFCKANAATGSGGFANGARVTPASGAVIVAWNSKAGTPPTTSYDQYSTENLDFAHTNNYSGSVRWDIKDGVSGIQFTDKYSAGDSVFFPVDGVTVRALQDTIDISGMNVTAANAAIASAITSVGNAGKDRITVVGTPMTITDSIVINLNAQVKNVNWFVDLTAAGMTKPLMTISTTHESGEVNNLAKIISADGYAVQGTTGTKIWNYGLIFGNSNEPNNIVNTPNKSSPSLLMSWDKSQGTTTYDVGTNNDILISNMCSHATYGLDSINVSWAYENGQSGIKYSYSDSYRHYNDVPDGNDGHLSFYCTGSGFIPVPGVTVVRNDVVIGDLDYEIPSSDIYNGSAQGIGEVTFNSLTEAQAGTITVKYNGSATVPTNAGTYTVTAEISGGSEYADTTITLPESYTIARKALTISAATVAAKAQDGLSSANVTRVTLDGDIDDLVPSTDYTMSGIYDDYLAGINRTVAVSVTLLNTTKANNYRVANEYSLTGQTINDPPTEVTFDDLEANGTSGTTDTTVLTLTFGSDITGLEATDITVAGATRGILARTEAGVYTLEISDITGTDDSIFEQGDSVTVTVEKDGFIIIDGTQSVTVNKDNRPDVTFTTAQAGGTVGTTDSTGIVITFSQTVTGLTADDITIATGTGTATKGTLSGSGTTYTIGLASVTAAGNVTVEVADFGAYDITTTGVSTAVYKNLTNAATPSITLQPQNATYAINTAASALSVTASVSDGGTLSYQWYSNSTNSNSGGTLVASTESYTPSTSTAGTVYYYCVITNTNDTVDGETIATATSSAASVLVLADATASASSSTYTQLVSGAITVTVTPNGHTFTGISDSISNLIVGEDYTISPLNSNVYTINTSYLDSLMLESVTLTFDADSGVDPQVSITIEPIPDDFIPVTGITLSSDTANINEPLTLIGVAAPSNATHQTIVWTVSDPGLTNASIIGNVFTADTTGTAQITATITDGVASGTDFETTFNITVTEGVPINPPVSVTGVSISGSSEVTIGNTISLAATVEPLNATNQNIVWSTNDYLIAAVSSTGVVTGRNAGTATIIATSIDGGIQGTVEITVNEPYVEPTTIYDVSISGGNATPASGAYGTLITVTATVPSGQEFVSWTVSGIPALSGSPASFTMPANDVIITAVFRDIPASPSEPSTPSEQAPTYDAPPPPTPPSTPSSPDPSAPTAEENPYVLPSMEVEKTENGTEYTAPNGVTSIVTETPDGGVKVEAGVNESGAVNAQATAAAVSEAAEIAKANGESSFTLQIPDNAQGLSKNTIQQLIEAAGGLDITLELTSVVDGETVGGVTLPLTSSTGEILTGLRFDSKRTAQTEAYVNENFNAEVLGSFETAQKGGWGATATLTVGLDKLGFKADNGTKLQALIYDPKAKKWYTAEAEIIDGNVVIITKRSGLITIIK